MEGRIVDCMDCYDRRVQWRNMRATVRFDNPKCDCWFQFFVAPSLEGSGDPLALYVANASVSQADLETQAMYSGVELVFTCATVTSDRNADRLPRLPRTPGT